MADIRIAFRCAYPECVGKPPTELIVKVPKGSVGTSAKKQKPVYCEHCNRPNLINLPETWDQRGPVLGDEVIGYSGSVPVVQGRKP